MVINSPKVTKVFGFRLEQRNFGHYFREVGSNMAGMRARKISPEIDLRVSFSKGQDGYIVAECLDIPGCISQGKTEGEALANVYDVVSTTFAMIVRDWIKNANSDGVHTSPINAKHKEVKVAFVRMRKTA